MASDSEGGAQHSTPEHRRLTYALVASLLAHGLLLTLTFAGSPGLWPNLGFPWQARRAEEPDLRAVIVQPQVARAEPTITVVDPWSEEPIQPATPRAARSAPR